MWILEFKGLGEGITLYGGSMPLGSEKSVHSPLFVFQNWGLC